MHATITITTGLPRAAVEGRLADLAGAGPFRVRDLTPLGGGIWNFAIHPFRPGLSVGFAKVAELLVLLAREFHVERVERISIDAGPVAASLAAADGVTMNT